MAEHEELVQSARYLVRRLIERGRELLATGVPIDRVQRRYLRAAMELLEEIETRAILASAADEHALEQMVVLVEELRRLLAEAEAELQAQLEGE